MIVLSCDCFFFFCFLFFFSLLSQCVFVDSGVVCEPCEPFYLSLPGSVFLFPSLKTGKVSRMKCVAWALAMSTSLALSLPFRLTKMTRVAMQFLFINNVKKKKKE